MIRFHLQTAFLINVQRKKWKSAIFLEKARLSIPGNHLPPYKRVAFKLSSAAFTSFPRHVQTEQKMHPQLKPNFAKLAPKSVALIDTCKTWSYSIQWHLVMFPTWIQSERISQFFRWCWSLKTQRNSFMLIPRSDQLLQYPLRRVRECANECFVDFSVIYSTLSNKCNKDKHIVASVSVRGERNIFILLVMRTLPRSINVYKINECTI